MIRVEILEAEPRRIFDRAVVKTLSPWRFDRGDDGRRGEIDVELAAEGYGAITDANHPILTPEGAVNIVQPPRG